MCLVILSIYGLIWYWNWGLVNEMLGNVRACLEIHKTEWYHPVFITHDPKLVRRTEEQLFGCRDSCSVTHFSWFCDSKKWVIVKTHFSYFQNSYSITQWQVCNIAEIVGPKSQALSHPTCHFFFLFFFSLSSSLSFLLCVLL